MLPVPFLMPPDGATEVPTDAEIVVAGVVDADLLVTADGDRVDGSVRSTPDRTIFTPDAPFTAGAEVRVRVENPEEFGEVVFHVGDEPATEPTSVPWVGGLRAEPIGRGQWAFTVAAEPPEGTAYGMFQVVYRVGADGEVDAVDALWPADSASEGTWEDEAPPGTYCAGVAYVDVAGNVTDAVEVCADLAEPDAPEAGCATVGGGTLALALGVLPLVRRRRA